MSQPGAAGAVLSTGGDLVRWSTALSGGRVVKPASYAMMVTPLVLDGRDTHYGFGLMLGQVAELPTVMHGGGIHGFNSFLVHVPQHDLHVAVISNGERVSSQKLAGAIVRVVLELPEFVAKDLPIPATLCEALPGDYRFDVIDMVLRVTADGEQLIAEGEGEGQQTFRLMFQGAREFRAALDHTVKLEFDDEGKHVALHQGGRVADGVRRSGGAAWRFRWCQPRGPCNDAAVSSASVLRRVPSLRAPDSQSIDEERMVEPASPRRETTTPAQVPFDPSMFLWLPRTKWVHWPGFPTPAEQDLAHLLSGVQELLLSDDRPSCRE